ncbi:oxidoreductase [Streptomyces netropsis]|uniref:NAD(P)-dependent dehydrogenase (Short-subunit alcohol dehydrogenase family) n=1 Tax=Streptomyces netropsis TaxID=55404 RepID=A0A7W7LF62_STRNE|nr:oxidoreductase [Streptomyces netropsis]MBB4889044.1 NAD(P)-dependent dehydrogenase (short-subunit alcohol dehydrogenase family) [Streptomyces netropsis]GGR10810.1 putative short-chain dehydrogenase/reductase [Streptomyces netropsis]
MTNAPTIADRWAAADIPDQSGRTAIVTGANSGLGYVTARELARRGARVVLTARNPEKGRAALGRLRDEQPGAVVELRPLDLADLDSVRVFAGTVDTPVDILINNAGIMMPPRSLTAQGFESQLGTNHLGHFALTGLLLDRLRAGRDPRVVTVSSTLHKNGSIRFDDLNGERSYSPRAFYAQSKFANVLFGLELDRRLRATGSPVRSLLAHPGYSATNLQSTGPTGMLNAILKVTNRLMAQDVETGALNQLYAAVEPRAEGGQFIGPNGRNESKGYPALVQPAESAKDLDTARRLWDLSERVTGVRYRFPAEEETGPPETEA